MIRLDSVSKRFPDGTVAVTTLTLEVPEGEICVLVGPSGCGKTTTLKMVNRLVEPTGGEVLVDGRNVLNDETTTLRRGIGLLPLAGPPRALRRARSPPHPPAGGRRRVGAAPPLAPDPPLLLMDE